MSMDGLPVKRFLQSILAVNRLFGEGSRGGDGWGGYPRWKGGPDLKQNENRLEIADGSFSSQWNKVRCLLLVRQKSASIFKIGFGFDKLIALDFYSLFDDVCFILDMTTTVGRALESLLRTEVT